LFIFFSTVEQQLRLSRGFVRGLCTILQEMTIASLLHKVALLLTTICSGLPHLRHARREASQEQQALGVVKKQNNGK
jgi:hypothetical protein